MSSELSVSVKGERLTVARGTRVREVLNGIPSKDLVAARVNDKVVDLSRTLESDANVSRSWPTAGTASTSSAIRRRI
jgi:sulfur carrier protein ThiS